MDPVTAISNFFAQIAGTIQVAVGNRPRYEKPREIIDNRSRNTILSLSAILIVLIIAILIVNKRK